MTNLFHCITLNMTGLVLWGVDQVLSECVLLIQAWLCPGSQCLRPMAMARSSLSQTKGNGKAFPWFECTCWLYSLCSQKVPTTASFSWESLRVLHYRDPLTQLCIQLNQYAEFLCCWSISITCMTYPMPTFPSVIFFHSLSPQSGEYQSHAGHGVVKIHEMASEQNIQGSFIEEYFHVAFTESMT